MKDYIEERAIEAANYIIDTRATVRQTADKMGISKSTVHKDITERLVRIRPMLAAQARVVLDANKAERHIRGGLAKKMAAGIAANAPIAVRNCKKAINDGLQVDMDQAIVIEEKLFGDCFETEDQKAGMGNFLEKDKEKKLKVVPFQNK